MLMDEVFGEQNRLAIINWQKTTVKNNSKHVSGSTEYILVYARELSLVKSRLLDRSEKSNARFGNPDNDPDGIWKQGDLTGTGADSHRSALYAIQSPFDGQLHYPGENRCWAFEKRRMKEWLAAWGSAIVERDLSDGRPPALVIKGAPLPTEANFEPNHKALREARNRASKKLKEGAWPRLYFGMQGTAKPMAKVYMSEIKAGVIPTTFWVDETPVEIGSASWGPSETGRTREGLEELDRIVGPGHNFTTVKPLNLIKKLIQIWCPPSGVVLDPYAGTGTTGHAVLALNKSTGYSRRFILIEQGAPDTGDKYARTLTWKRLHNAITGERPNGAKAEALGGAFEYRLLTKQIDAKTVLSMKKDELVDVVITSHWETSSRNSPGLIRIEEPKYRYLVGKNDRDEGYFIIWDGEGPVGQLDRDTYKDVLKDAEKAGLKPPYHVYARYELYQSKNVQFWKIPDKILAHLGLNENSDRFNEED